MKTIMITILLISLLFVQNAFSVEIPNTISGQVEDVYCSEVDPFIGDQCIVYTTDQLTGKKYGLIFDESYWAEAHVTANKSISDFVGETFHVEFCYALYDWDAINEYQQIDKNYFYVSCNENLFKWQNSLFIKNTILKNISANIVKAWCGELNPYSADLCIIKAKGKQNDQEYLFIFEDFEWMTKYLKSDDEIDTLSGQSFKISSCEKVEDINVLADFNKKDREQTYKCGINNFSWQ